MTLHWEDSHFGTEPALLGDVGLNATRTEFGQEALLDCPDADDIVLSGEVDFGTDTVGARIKTWWHNRQAAKAAKTAATGRKGKAHGNIIQQAAASGDPYALGQGLMSNLTDADSELEALQSAVDTDPYALGQDLSGPSADSMGIL